MKLEDLIGFVFDVHSQLPITPEKAFRKFDGKTPFATHPVWCGMMILTENSLPEDKRYDGAQALLLHDIIEDTKADLPDDLSYKVKQLVLDMTFESFNDECALIWNRSKFVRMLKLYEKVHNLLNTDWMAKDKLKFYIGYVLRLTEDVEENWGLLNIVIFSKALCAVKIQHIKGMP